VKEAGFCILRVCVCVYSALSTCRKLLVVGFDNLTTSIRQLLTAYRLGTVNNFKSFCFWHIIWNGEFCFVSDVDNMECVTKFVYDIFVKSDETCDT
jgi:hypothetical protein